MIKGNSEYISLREAAKMSGYSPDYVGQLIRNGKLHGKQIFSNVAWVTTKEAVHEYMTKENKKESSGSVRAEDWALSIEGIVTLYRWISLSTLAVAAVLLFFLFFVFAISIDHWFENSSRAPASYGT